MTVVGPGPGFGTVGWPAGSSFGQKGADCILDELSDLAANLHVLSEDAHRVQTMPSSDVIGLPAVYRSSKVKCADGMLKLQVSFHP